jgi:peptidoglycan hydrolase-like protein with peptidoglycan-binding domain
MNVATLARFQGRPFVRVQPSGDAAPPPSSARRGGDVMVPRTAPQESDLRRAGIAMYQQMLAVMGATDNGAMRPDGVLGPRTRNAIKEFQRWWAPARINAPNADPTDTGGGPTRWQEALRQVGGRVVVDGVLGPMTQRLLLWLAMPVARGGGGEAEDYASIPVVGDVVPLRLMLLGDGPMPTGYELRAPGSAPVATPATPTPAGPRPTFNNASNTLDGSILGSVEGRPGNRRTLELAGLDPQLGARVFVGTRDVTLLAPEDGTVARWVAPGIWRMGVPADASTVRVVFGEGGAADVELPPPPAGSEADITARSVRVAFPPRQSPGAPPAPPATTPGDVPVGTTPDGSGVPPQGDGSVPPAAPPPEVAQAGAMGSGVILVGGLAVAAAALLLASRKR